MLSRLSDLTDRFHGASTADCQCLCSFEEPTGTAVGDRVELVVDADGCPGRGDLAASPECRATVVDALADRDADVVRSVSGGRERTYADRAAALLLAAGRFVERAAFHDERLAERARRDPLGAAHDARGRADATATIAAETGLAEVAAAVGGGDGDGNDGGVGDDDSDRDTDTDHDDTADKADVGRYGHALAPFVGPTVARAHVRLATPPDATLVDRWSLDTGATVRLYDRAGDGREYHLEPVAHTLDDRSTRTLAAAEERLAHGGVEGGTRAPGRAVRAVADDDEPVETLAGELATYTRGHGVLEDPFADPRVSDVFVTAPVTENPVRVTVDGETVPTNVRLTPGGVATLASRFRRTSGKPFSRATPTIDAVVDVGENAAVDGEAGSVRVAGVSAPASDGLGFAFRRHDAEAWTLPALVANDTLPADAAAVLSVAVERAAAGLVAGARGAGKTTLLGALLWELPARTRTVTIEDTPELPVDALQTQGRDVQPLYAGSDDGAALTPTEALRTALRLGEGALVVGEVRGEEAATLYEAMRVGASGSAVLGTIHGDGGQAVRERVVSDLDVPESSFGATDLLVTCAAGDSRHVASIEEVRTTDDGVRFASLFERTGYGLEPTGTVARGNSTLVADLTRADESYADLRRLLDEREKGLAALATTGRTRPDDVVAAYRGRGRGRKR
ncbi:Type IV secretory pathway ATPase VirB11/Archaellum biosynthesis ATPase [Halogranum gelatinilyticum]|uniref:Type IV secretory pathway ATPase VirB11/Archaellum biosynthesis ATPase n=1 Tax=Halogranum gelatinilyticum TaxID=660521 RepID=A0A1G9QI92_9EURY|nr:ATPase, T2SS/T4P/T4SS family [Halogranum gelatinilyticum]SDM10774.1 Type IV secretory pathway ATPase VirB11/Archaellum biosynthesis ATPase [Halogranum gelatinilyticum]